MANTDNKKPKGGPPKIDEQSNQAISSYMNAVRQAESSGNDRAEAKKSSAKGRYQFVKSTWEEMEKKLGKKMDRFNPEHQEIAMRRFTEDNAKVLKNKGIDVTPQNLYLAHVLGTTGGPSFIKKLQENPNALASKYATEGQVAANPGLFLKKGKPVTAAELYNTMSEKVKAPKTDFGQGTGQMPQPQTRFSPEEIMNAQQSIDNTATSQPRVDPNAVAPKQVGEEKRSFNVDESRKKMGLTGNLDYLSSDIGLAFTPEEQLENEGYEAEENIQMARDGGPQKGKKIYKETDRDSFEPRQRINTKEILAEGEDRKSFLKKGLISNPSSAVYKNLKKSGERNGIQPNVSQDSRTSTQKEIDKNKGNQKEYRKNVKEKGLKTLEIASDIAQVGNFIPNPAAQTIGKVGNYAGAAVDAYKAYENVQDENYGEAALNVADLALPLSLESKAFKRSSKYIKPGDPMYSLTPQSKGNVFGKGSRTDYIDVTKATKGMTNINLAANRGVLGYLATDTYGDATETNEKADGGELEKRQMNLQENGFLNEFNEGGKHEENPHGGIPQGMGENGQMNTVEEGETKMGNYVFSDTLIVNEDDAESLFLPKDIVGKTFAEASKYVNEIMKDNPNDKIIKRTVEKQLDSLTLGNEKARLAKEEMDLNMQENEGMDLDMQMSPEMQTSMDTEMQPEMEMGQEMDPEMQGQNQMFLGGEDGDDTEGYVKLGTTAMDFGNKLFGDNSPQMGSADENGIADPERISSGGAMLSGAMSGASAGAMFGPWGAAVGGVVGGGVGLVSSIIGNNEADKIERRNHIKRAGVYNNDFKEGGEMRKVNKFGGGGDTDPLKKKDPYGLDLSSVLGSQFKTPGIDYSPGVIPEIVERLGSSGMPNWLSKGIKASNEITKNTDPRQFGKRMDHYVAPNTPEDVDFKAKGTNALQYAPILGNAINYLDAKNEKAEVTSLDRLSARYKPQYADEMSIQNISNDNFDNTINSLAGGTNGSQGALRANILGAGLNKARGQSEAYTQAAEYNRGQDNTAQQFNLNVDQANMSQSNMEDDFNARARSSQKDREISARNGLFESIGAVGKEGTYNNRLINMTGYDSSGKYNPEQLAFLKKFFEDQSKSNTKRTGGILSSFGSSIFNKNMSLEEQEFNNQYR